MGYSGPQAGQRIPETLQQVFLASNRGRVVDQPPPERAASRTFFNWFKKPKNNKKQENLKRTQSSRRTRRTSLSSTVSSSSSVDSTPSPRSSRRKISKMMSGGDLQLSSPRTSITSRKKSSFKTKTPPPAAGVPMVQVSMSPQGYLDSLLRQRGYSTQKYRTLESSYYNKPTPLQLSSYHTSLVSMVRDKDEKHTRDLISCGLSPNPCNTHGESVIHGICRRNDYRILQLMISMGASVQVSDDQGRTPLHEACWGATNCFATVDVVLQQDPRLIHMMDARGATPLSFVRTENWPSWIKFLRSRMDLYWPLRDADDDVQGPPPRALEEPHSRPLPDPKDPLTPELAAMVAAGRITPQEAEFLMEDDEDASTMIDDEETDCGGDDSDSFYSDLDLDEFDDDSFIMESAESFELDAVPEEQTEHTEHTDKGGEDQHYQVPHKSSPCPEVDPISSVYSSDDSHHDYDSDNDDIFNEAEIESLIQGITAGKDISWSK